MLILRIHNAFKFSYRLVLLFHGFLFQIVSLTENLSESQFRHSNRMEVNVYGAKIINPFLTKNFKFNLISMSSRPKGTKGVFTKEVRYTTLSEKSFLYVYDGLNLNTRKMYLYLSSIQATLYKSPRQVLYSGGGEGSIPGQ